MEFLTTRVVASASKSFLKGQCSVHNIQSGGTTSGLSRTCFSSAAYQRVEGFSGYGKARARDQNHNENNVENMSGMAGFVTDTSVRGTVGAAEMETMDKAWDSAKKTSQNIEDTVVAAADENVVDTSEYRTIEDLKNFAEGDNGHGGPTYHDF